MTVWGVLLAGGMGTRLAPLSTPAKPKQFLDLTSSGITLLQQTFLRATQDAKHENIIVVGNKLHKELIEDQLPIAQTILETESKNTAASIFLAARQIKQGMMVIMPSDHYIKGNFKLPLINAFQLANAGKIVTLGIRPTEPNINYGYIVNNKFHEKPNRIEAAKLILQSAHWNSGIYIARAKVLLEEFKKHVPEFFENDFSNFPKISFDKAIAEKTDKIAMVKASFEWSDLGSFEAIAKLRQTA